MRDRPVREHRDARHRGRTAGPNDGIAFKPGSASYNGLPIPATVLTFDSQGKATHPFAKNPDGSALVVSGKPGDQLVVLQLPFASYGPDQPPAQITFTGVTSPLAQPNASYPVTATGGFQFQSDAAGNPTVNVATIGSTTTAPVEPQLFRLRTTSSAPEAETAVGPNFKHTYTVSMAVVPGQTVENLLLTDILPGTIQFVSVDSVAGNGTTVVTPVATPSTATPGGTLSRRLDKVVGTGSDADAVTTFTSFVPQKDAFGNDVIPLGTGGTAIATNTAGAAGEWFGGVVRGARAPRIDRRNVAGKPMTGLRFSNHSHGGTPHIRGLRWTLVFGRALRAQKSHVQTTASESSSPARETAGRRVAADRLSGNGNASRRRTARG